MVQMGDQTTVMEGHRISCVAAIVRRPLAALNRVDPVGGADPDVPRGGQTTAPRRIAAFRRQLVHERVETRTRPARAGKSAEKAATTRETTQDLAVVDRPKFKTVLVPSVGWPTEASVALARKRVTRR